MRRKHFAAWAPHCPICIRDRGQSLPLLLGEITAEAQDDVEAATLVCAEASCRAEFPIIDGIPIIMANLRQHLGERAVELLLRDDLDPAVLSLLGDALGPDSWFDQIRQGVSTYAWDSYADADPAEAAGAQLPGAARRCLAALLALIDPVAVAAAGRVLDLGCAGGRTAFEVAAAAPSGLVLGIDSNLSLLRLARRAARQGEVDYDRRRIGLVYDRRRFTADLPGRDRVDFWACDATALPLAAGSADLILALNLLDCVPDPVGFLHHLAAMLRPGGALLVATPFDWATRATPALHWIGGHSQRGPGAGAAEPLLRSLLAGEHERGPAGLTVVGETDQDWHTRLHERAAVSYRTHCIAAKKTILRHALDKQM
ncbi:MAG: methyltransferase domain-containing protein [Alphaproteobacteria bacterium]|nr:MAG: methyltransferase domain-containing protein [Alphaproteobacteria bacterium]